MSRPIEFRIPITSFPTGEFVGFEYWSVSHGCFSLPRGGFSNDLVYGDDEQWTGLYDKKANKVFEGDIVKVKALCDNLYMVENQETIDEVAFSNGHFYVKGIASTIYPDDMELEVLGNVHENSNLIGNDE
jgi:YopX protein